MSSKLLQKHYGSKQARLTTNKNSISGAPGQRECKIYHPVASGGIKAFALTFSQKMRRPNRDCRDSAGSIVPGHELGTA